MIFFNGNSFYGENEWYYVDDYNNHQNDFLKKIIEGYLKILFSILKKMGKMRKILDNAISGFLHKHTDTLYIV